MVLLDNNKKQKKEKTKNKHSLKDCMNYFFNFLNKNIIHDKIILFHAAFVVQKNMMRAGYAERILNNYGHTIKAENCISLCLFLTTGSLYCLMDSFSFLSENGQNKSN